MNIRINKSFGLALMLALGVIATMIALGMFTSGKVGAAPDANVEPTINDAAGNPSAGANVQVEVTFTNDRTPIANFGELTIELEGWGIPNSIDVRDVSVRAGDGMIIRDSANPEDVRVEGNTITIELNEIEGVGVIIQANEVGTIVFREGAGLTAPATAGDYGVSVGGASDDDAVTVSAELSADPSEGGSGTTITVSGKALADGTATLYSRGVVVVVDSDGNVTSVTSALPDRTKIKDVSVSFGAFSTEVEAKDLETAVGGYSRLEVVDAEGNDAGEDSSDNAVTGVLPSATATFQVTGTTTVSPASIERGGLIEISLSDWIQALPDAVMIGGVAVAITDEDGVAASVPVLDNDLESTFYVKVGAGVDLGTKTLVLSAGSARLDSTTSVEITSMALSVDPSSAVAGQEITVEGSGFSGGALLATLTVGGTAQPDLSDGNTVAATRVTSGGRVVLTFVVPDGVTDGSNTVAVIDEDGRIGEVSLTVPEPTIALDPPSSRRGSAVVVNGSGFPAYEFIRVTRAGSEVDIVRSNNMGNWATTIRIPSTATIGGAPADVVASVTVGTTPYEAEAEHSVPGADITLSTDTGRGGDTITITGEAFPAFQRVVVQVGGLSDIITGATPTETATSAPLSCCRLSRSGLTWWR